MRVRRETTSVSLPLLSRLEEQRRGRALQQGPLVDLMPPETIMAGPGKRRASELWIKTCRRWAGRRALRLAHSRGSRSLRARGAVGRARAWTYRRRLTAGEWGG